MPAQTEADVARMRAESRFKRQEQIKADAADALARVEADRIATDEKTARLRALRLAKEESDRLDALKRPKAPASTRRPVARKAAVS